MTHRIASIFIFLISLATVVLAQKDAAKPVKLAADEVIARHRAAIGTDAAIAAVRSRVLVGTAAVNGIVQFSARVSGAAQFASSGDMFLMAMIFDSNPYPYEKAAYDGDDLTTGRPNGAFTDLGEFLKSNKVMVRRNLFGGALSINSPLIVPHKDVKFEAEGTAEIDGRQTYKLKCDVAKAGGLTIEMFFDAETFRHIQTEYNYNIPPRMGSITTNASQKPSYFTLIEKFSNFKKADDLTLPFAYQITVSSQTPAFSRTVKWQMNFTQIYNNQPLEPKLFKVS